MITDPDEIAELRKSTEDLIASEGMEIALIRHGDGWTRTESGGIRKNTTTQPGDAMPAKRRFFGDTMDRPRTFQNMRGEELTLNRVLIGLVDDDIREGDEFMIGDRKFLVGEVHPDRIYEVKAWVKENV